jgi:hypothetical protein
MHYMYLRFIQFLYFKNTDFCKIYIFFVAYLCKRFEYSVVDVYLFATYLSLPDIFHLYSYNKLNIHYTTLILTEEAVFKLQPVLNFEKVVVYRLFPKKLDKRKGLGH